MSITTKPKQENSEANANAIIYQGDLKKKNKYFWNQARLFILYKNGRMEYFKDRTLLRGFIQLTPDSKVIRTAKDKFEI